VAGAKKYKYNSKYNTNTYKTKYTPPSGVFSFPGLGKAPGAAIFKRPIGAKSKLRARAARSPVSRAIR
jgi:hypothetical protein